MKITVLLEDKNNKHPELTPQHGLALFVEANGKKIMLDFGENEIYKMNAEIMGIDLSEVDFGVVSHSHDDHGGGLTDFLEVNDHAPVYLSEHCGQGYFFKVIGVMKKNVGIEMEMSKSPQYLNAQGQERMVWVTSDMQIEEGFELMFNTHHESFIPKGNSALLMTENGKLVADSLRHEMILVVKEEDGLVLMTGCSHGGVTNMIKTVKDKYPEARIKAVVGGFHLMNPFTGMLAEAQDTIAKLAYELDILGVEKIITGHCTGTDGLDILQGTCEREVMAMHTGDVIIL